MKESDKKKDKGSPPVTIVLTKTLTEFLMEVYEYTAKTSFNGRKIFRRKSVPTVDIEQYKGKKVDIDKEVFREILSDVIDAIEILKKKKEKIAEKKQNPQEAAGCSLTLI